MDNSRIIHGNSCLKEKKQVRGMPVVFIVNTRRSPKFLKASNVYTPWQNALYPLAENHYLIVLCQGYTH